MVVCAKMGMHFVACAPRHLWPEEELINRLIEYKKYKETTPILKQLEEERKDLFTKSTSSLKEFKSDEIKLGEDVTLDDLLKAFSRFLERKNLKL